MTFPSEWLTVAEAATVMKVGRKLIYREVAAGRLRAAHIGGRRDIRIARTWVDDYLRACAEPVEIKLVAGRRG
jgi:excisionase family DNA binding protein